MVLAITMTDVFYGLVRTKAMRSMNPYRNESHLLLT